MLVVRVTARVALAAAAGWLLAQPPAIARGQQPVALPTAAVRNLQVESGADGKLTIVYDLVASDPKAAITISLEAGLTPRDSFDIKPQAVEGDVGERVRPGERKRIVWDAPKDVEEVQTGRFRFRVVASATSESATARTSPGRATLTVVSSPDGAQIVLDGRPIGLAPLEIRNVSPGRHRLTARRAGYAEFSRIVDLTRDEMARIDLPLTAATETSGQTPAGKGSGLKWIAIGGGAAAAIAAAAAGSGGSAAASTPPSSTTPSTPTTTTPTTPTNRAPTVTCGNIVFGGLRTMVATDVAVVSATRLQFVIASASDADGDSLSFTISFGNGANATATYSVTNNSTTYIYPGAGVYSPSVTVRDARGGEAGCRFPTVTTSTVAGEWLGPPTVGRISSRFVLSQSGLNVSGTYFEAERAAGSAVQGTLSSNVAGRKDGTMALTVGGNYGSQLTFLLEPGDNVKTFKGTFTYRGSTSAFEMRKNQ